VHRSCSPSVAAARNLHGVAHTRCRPILSSHRRPYEAIVRSSLYTPKSAVSLWIQSMYNYHIWALRHTYANFHGCGLDLDISVSVPRWSPNLSTLQSLMHIPATTYTRCRYHSMQYLSARFDYCNLILHEALNLTHRSCTAYKIHKLELFYGSQHDHTLNHFRVHLPGSEATRPV